MEEKKPTYKEVVAEQVNAFYNPQNNPINIMAGILSDEIYNEDMNYEQKLGGIGTVIGQEISYAFDTNKFTAM